MSDDELDALISAWRAELEREAQALDIPLRGPSAQQVLLQGILKQVPLPADWIPLSLHMTPFSVHIQESILFAWSALSCLVLPGLLREKIRIKTTCPATGAAIQMDLSPEGIEALWPQGCVLSVAPPQYSPTGGWLEGPDPIHFANRVMWFFSSRRAASLWLLPYPGVQVLDLGEAWRFAEATIMVDYE